jgi:hypothetical protein
MWGLMAASTGHRMVVQDDACSCFSTAIIDVRNVALIKSIQHQLSSTSFGYNLSATKM